MSHNYLSTACWHELNDGRPALHTACRASCKFCDQPCGCPIHQEDTGPPTSESWVDQARNIARELWEVIEHYEYEGPEVPGNLRTRIATDRALFWLRGEETPPGQRSHP